jgi:hypothetical protein
VGLLPEVDADFIRRCIDELERRGKGDEVQRVYEQECCGMPENGAGVRKGVIEALLVTRDRNALYFIVRALLLQLISSGIFLLALAFLVTINFFQAIFLGLLIFTVSLALSKLLDAQLHVATRIIIAYLESHEEFRNTILQYF